MNGRQRYVIRYRLRDGRRRRLYLWSAGLPWLWGDAEHVLRAREPAPILLGSARVTRVTRARETPAPTPAKRSPSRPRPRRALAQGRAPA